MSTKSTKLDQHRTLAKSANAIMFKNANLNCAPTSATQIADVLAATKGHQLKTRIATSTKLLTAYAQSDVEITKLPVKTREYLTAVADKSAKSAVKNNRVYKSWPRKNAAILVALINAKPKTKRAPQPTTTVEPTE